MDEILNCLKHNQGFPNAYYKMKYLRFIFMKGKICTRLNSPNCFVLPSDFKDLDVDPFKAEDISSYILLSSSSTKSTNFKLSTPMLT